MAKLGVFKLLSLAGEITELFVNLAKYRADLQAWEARIYEAQQKGEVVNIPLKPAQQEGVRKVLKQLIKLADKIAAKVE